MKKLIICSGGIDSVAMAIIESLENDIELINFNYGQKASKEIEICEKVAKMLSCKLTKIDLSAMNQIFGKNQLTSDIVDVENRYEQSVVVPLRNALFCQISMIYASTNNFDEIVLGSHLNDIQTKDGEMMYPDSSPDFFKAFEIASALGKFKSDKLVKVVSASTLGMTKKDIIKKANEIRPDILPITWSCYLSKEKQCGICEACINRKKAFEVAGIQDLTEYEQ